MTAADFPDFFKALWGFDPFPWQTMLAERAVAGRWPRVLSLPTAAGKTACLDIAVFALALEADKPLAERLAPRRIWFAVDRRIVVDEAFTRAEKVAKALFKPADYLGEREEELEPSERKSPAELRFAARLLGEVADQLKRISGLDHPDAPPLATARLRGGVLRDDGWARLPSQPAIITSTVDQLGSRLLFRAYGPGDSVAPIHAALAANDSLILLDEAHCAVPFAQTLSAIERFRGPHWCEEYLPLPFSFSILSATPPEEFSEDVFPAAEEKAAALDHEKLQQRMAVGKLAQLCEAKPPKGTKAVPLHIGSARHDDSLVLAAAEQACVFAFGTNGPRVAIMVNRVATAEAIANVLRAAVGVGDDQRADVVLLTGRMRPLDRDALVEEWSKFLRANTPDTPLRPIIVVTTQCLEVGADFSFDALVTECASLDALRQRFGRLNRLGVHDSAPAVIFARAEDVNPAAEDPIYGQALTRTWEWLHAAQLLAGDQQAVVDFGIAALDRLLAERPPVGLMAPTADAPVLLPAHLDMLCQTSPRPDPEPEIGLFLHGKKPSQPQASVVWRADLPDENRNVWKDIVALLPPSSGEMLQAPLFRIRRWLAEQAPARTEADGDVESVASSGDDSGPVPSSSNPFLIWRGRKKPPILSTNSASIRPGDIVVVSARLSPAGLGQHVPPNGRTTGGVGANGVDLAERAWYSRRRQPVLRVTPAVLGPWQAWEPIAQLLAVAEDPAATRSEIHEALAEVRDRQDEQDCLLPPWLKEIIANLKKSPRSERHPSGGLIFFGPKVFTASEQVAFGGEDELLDTEKPQLLRAHTADVLHYGERFAVRCLPGAYHSAVLDALGLHDVGKLDPRFQLMLHGGDEIARDGTPIEESLAKSAKDSAKLSRNECGLPAEFGHEMLSLQIAEHRGWLSADEKSAALTAHLIASHHGSARPWAPIAPDLEPPAITLLDGSTISETERRAWTPSHHLSSGIGDRFWQLTRRFGWWGLPLLEAVVRLTDWHASACPREEKAKHGALKSQATFYPPSLSEKEIELTGIDGGNPLGFLAALGAFRILSRALPQHSVRLAWSTSQHPLIIGNELPAGRDFAKTLATALRCGFQPNACFDELRNLRRKRLDSKRALIKEAVQKLKSQKLRGDALKAARGIQIAPLSIQEATLRRKWLRVLRRTVPFPELALAKGLEISASELRDFLQSAVEEDRQSAMPGLEMLAHFGSDACFDSKSGRIEGTPFCFIKGSGQQFFLDTIRQLVTAVDSVRLQSCLFSPWVPLDEKLSMRWLPQEDRRYALMAANPSTEIKAVTVWAANLLGYAGLGVLPSAPTPHGLRTTGFRLSEEAFIWPLWRQPLTVFSISALLSHPLFQDVAKNRADLLSVGVSSIFSSTRIEVGKAPLSKLNFTPAVCL